MFLLPEWIVYSVLVIGMLSCVAFTLLAQRSWKRYKQDLREKERVVQA